MHIKEIRAINFRNHSDLMLDFSPGINFISGPNAAGKTNILEAVSVTSNIKSFRNISDSEIIQRGGDSYYCCSKIEGSENSLFEIGCSINQDKIRKKAKIDGVEKKKLSDYYGRFLTVIFSPEDINIINGPPEARRRFFDGIISKADSEYLKAISDFKRILSSRNRILKDLNERKSRATEDLDVWDILFSEKVSIIIKKRSDFIDRFNPSFSEAYSGMALDDAAPNICYCPALETGDRVEILKRLKESRKRDINRGITGSGPHRDDYVIASREGILFKNYASQGQKRSASISLRISESRLIEKNTGEIPVILIDDIFGELDDTRRGHLLERIIRNNQTIITSVSKKLVENPAILNDIANFVVECGGKIRRV